MASLPPYLTYNPVHDTKEALLRVFNATSHEAVITLYHGTTRKIAEEDHGAHDDGTVHPTLRCGVKGDFGWGGKNEALYFTPSLALAKHYAEQHAEYKKATEIAIIRADLPRSAVALLEITDIGAWQEIVAWGWQNPVLKPKAKPAVLDHLNVVAGWCSTTATVSGEKNYWPVKYLSDAATHEYTFDFQYTVLDQPTLDHMTNKHVTFEAFKPHA